MYKYTDKYFCNNLIFYLSSQFEKSIGVSISHKLALQIDCSISKRMKTF